jgi:hypothetical protein
MYQIRIFPTGQVTSESEVSPSAERVLRCVHAQGALLNADEMRKRAELAVKVARCGPHMPPSRLHTRVVVGNGAVDGGRFARSHGRQNVTGRSTSSLSAEPVVPPGHNHVFGRTASRVPELLDIKVSRANQPMKIPSLKAESSPPSILSPSPEMP